MKKVLKVTYTLLIALSCTTALSMNRRYVVQRQKEEEAKKLHEARIAAKKLSFLRQLAFIAEHAESREEGTEALSEEKYIQNPDDLSEKVNVDYSESTAWCYSQETKLKEDQDYLSSNEQEADYAAEQEKRFEDTLSDTRSENHKNTTYSSTQRNAFGSRSEARRARLFLGQDEGLASIKCNNRNGTFSCMDKGLNKIWCNKQEDKSFYQMDEGLARIRRNNYENTPSARRENRELLSQPEIREGLKKQIQSTLLANANNSYLCHKLFKQAEKWGIEIEMPGAATVAECPEPVLCSCDDLHFTLGFRDITQKSPIEISLAIRPANSFGQFSDYSSWSDSYSYNQLSPQRHIPTVCNGKFIYLDINNKAHREAILELLRKCNRIQIENWPALRIVDAENRELDQIRTYEQLAESYRSINGYLDSGTAVKRIINSASVEQALALGSMLNDEHFVECCAELDAKLENAKNGWDKVEDRIVAFQEKLCKDGGLKKGISPNAYRYFNKRALEIRVQRTCADIIYKSLTNYCGEQNLYAQNHAKLMQIAQLLGASEHLTFYTFNQNHTKGYDKELGVKLASTLARKIKAALEVTDTSCIAKESKITIEELGYIARNLTAHNPDFEKHLLQKAGKAYKYLKEESIAYRNERIKNYLGTDYAQLVELSHTFNLHPDSLLSPLKLPEQQEYQKKVIDILNKFSKMPKVEKDKPLIKSLVQFSLQLNEQNKTQQAQELYDVLQGVSLAAQGTWAKVIMPALSSALKSANTGMAFAGTKMKGSFAANAALLIAKSPVGIDLPATLCFPAYVAYKLTSIGLYVSDNSKRYSEDISHLWKAALEGKPFDIAKFAGKVGMDVLEAFFMSDVIANTITNAHERQLKQGYEKQVTQAMEDAIDQAVADTKELVKLKKEVENSEAKYKKTKSFQKLVKRAQKAGLSLTNKKLTNIILENPHGSYTEDSPSKELYALLSHSFKKEACQLQNTLKCNSFDAFFLKLVDYGSRVNLNSREGVQALRDAAKLMDVIRKIYSRKGIPPAFLKLAENYHANLQHKVFNGKGVSEQYGKDATDLTLRAFDDLADQKLQERDPRHARAEYVIQGAKAANTLYANGNVEDAHNILLNLRETLNNKPSGSLELFSNLSRLLGNVGRLPQAFGGDSLLGAALRRPIGMVIKPDAVNKALRSAQETKKKVERALGDRTQKVILKKIEYGLGLATEVLNLAKSNRGPMDTSALLYADTLIKVSQRAYELETYEQRDKLFTKYATGLIDYCERYKREREQLSAGACNPQKEEKKAQGTCQTISPKPKVIPCSNGNKAKEKEKTKCDAGKGQPKDPETRTCNAEVQTAPSLRDPAAKENKSKQPAGQQTAHKPQAGKVPAKESTKQPEKAKEQQKSQQQAPEKVITTVSVEETQLPVQGEAQSLMQKEVSPSSKVTPKATKKEEARRKIIEGYRNQIHELNPNLISLEEFREALEHFKHIPGVLEAKECPFKSIFRYGKLGSDLKDIGNVIGSWYEIKTGLKRANEGFQIKGFSVKFEVNGIIKEFDLVTDKDLRECKHRRWERMSLGDIERLKGELLRGLQVAKEIGLPYVLESAYPIPKELKEWLKSNNITFFEG